VEAECDTSESSEGEETETAEEKGQGRTKWKKEDLKNSPMDGFLFDSMDHDHTMTPYQCFQLFMDKETAELIQQFSIMYANQCGENLNLSVDEVYVFLGIHYFSGYHTLPSKEMYWEMAEDCNTTLVRQSMSRDRFREICKFLHVADNLNLTPGDRFAKVTPFAKRLRENFHKYAITEQCLSIDEAMIKYYGRHGCKQYIKGKPIRFGYKVWCINLVSGYLVSFDFYQGKSASIPKTPLGLGGSVVVSLTDRLPGRGYHIFCNRFFTSFPLIQHMAEKGIAVTGTVMKNRICHCPVDPLNKVLRGSFDYRRSEDGILVATWRDSATVYLASSASPIYPLSKAER
jgi:DNA excision repair protein ERCC-6